MVKVFPIAWLKNHENYYITQILIIMPLELHLGEKQCAQVCEAESFVGR